MQVLQKLLFHSVYKNTKITCTSFNKFVPLPILTTTFLLNSMNKAEFCVVEKYQRLFSFFSFLFFSQVLDQEAGDHTDSQT